MTIRTDAITAMMRLLFTNTYCETAIVHRIKVNE